MELSFAFPPDGARARALDGRMRSQLADSLDYLRQAIAKQLGAEIAGIGQVIEGMRRGVRYPPSTFGLYYEISSALIEGDLEGAKSLFDELIQEQPLTDHQLKVITLDDISKPSNVLRYQRLMDTDPTAPFHIVPPPAETGRKSVERFQSALNRLRQALPELADEFEELIREVILVVGDTKTGYEFAGGSCYMLWGALFINAEMHTTDIATIEAIAHESAHSLLFGFTIDEPLVENPDSEVFSSPLRDDPRPMDGIFHATFVSARMHWAMSALLDSGLLNPDEIEFASAARETDFRNFFSGYETVAKYARMTQTGNRLMEGAYQYMKQFGSVQGIS